MSAFLPDEAIARLQAMANWPDFEAERYTILDELGRGGMGAVYLALDARLGREVAIKVSAGVPGAEVERRLNEEARILAALEHPGIVPIHDAGRLADGRLFYVMKRVRGATLSEHLRGVPSLSERLGIFERICEAVHFAHAQGIVHRDLKPDNVMIGEFGEVLVMDWGAAQACGPADGRTVLGTHGFMAPEQARADAIDARADVYSLGAVLSWLCEGSTAPRALRAIWTRAMAPAREGRYPSASALAADVARFRAGHAVDAHRESVLERGARFARTYRVAIMLVLAYIVMRAVVAYVRS
ncbi:MAG TPA: serine/threonine-protein kinase [Vicinamibacterales bacterium]|nr:serine/threonine-protein kinase [Vicinamibacterales bacterium]